VQKNAVAVQQVLDECLCAILRKKVTTVGSGRTDTGVHAVEQVVHFDVDRPLIATDFIYKLNSLLPKDIAARELKAVQSTANSRFDAIERAYSYRMVSVKNPFLENEAYYFRKELDLEKINSLSGILKNWNDYECFSRVKTDVNHFLCDVFNAEWSTEGDLIIFNVTANRYLRGMVRSMVGTMLEVGLGRMLIEDFKHILASKDRRKAGRSVPPHGLFLQSVKYPDKVFIDL